MAKVERVARTMPAEMAAALKSVVEAGDYPSTSEVVRAALRDWRAKRALQLQELGALKADINVGLRDMEVGRIKDFETDKIIAAARKPLTDRSSSV